MRLAERVDRSIVIQRTILQSKAPALLAERIRSKDEDRLGIGVLEQALQRGAGNRSMPRGKSFRVGGSP